MVYLDADEGPVVAVEPKAEFAALFEMMAASEGEGGNLADGIVILLPGDEFFE